MHTFILQVDSDDYSQVCATGIAARSFRHSYDVFEGAIDALTINKMSTSCIVEQSVA